MVKTVTLAIIVILIFAFYQLAKKYDKSPWYGALGILVFFICFLVSEFISIKLINFLVRQEVIERSTSLSWYISFLTVLVVGIIFCREAYNFVEKKWKKEKPKSSNRDILDDEMLK